MTRKILHTLKIVFLAAACLAGVAVATSSVRAYAAPKAPTPTPAPTTTKTTTTTTTPAATTAPKTTSSPATPCSGNPLTYDPSTDQACIGTGGVDSNGTVVCQKDKTCTVDCAATTQCDGRANTGGIKLITDYANPIINFLAGAIGVFITIQIVIGGIQYSTSADDTNKVNAARARITNAVVALLAFLFLYTFLQWITPGGFLN